MVNALTLIASASLLAPFVHAYGMIGQVVDANNFCVFLPPEDEKNRNIADTEWEGQAFCLGKTPDATNAGKLNKDFIKSAHFLATDKYIQVTGQMDPSKQNLDPKDDGGQFDVRAPRGSSCAGWKYYVNLIEPVTKTYCMRCCNDDRTCNRGISEKGCFHIIPGDYSGPYGGVEDGYPNDSEAAASSGSGSVPQMTKTTASKTTTTSTTTENPTTTKEPKTTEEPAKESTTEAPTTTKAPETTKVPEVTEAPETSDSPAATTAATQGISKSVADQQSSADEKSSSVADEKSSAEPSTTSAPETSKPSESLNSKTANVQVGDDASAQSVNGVESLKPALGFAVSAVTAVFLMA